MAIFAGDSERGIGPSPPPPAGGDPGELVLLALAEAHVLLEPGAQRGVEGFEERALVAFAGLPADLAADRFHHLALRLRVVLPQHAFEHLQLVLAVDRQLGLAEAVGRRGAGAAGDRHRLHQLVPLGLDHPGPGDEVAGAQVVAVEEREQHEHRQPDAARRRRSCPSRRRAESRNTSGMNTSTSRIRLRAITASAVSRPPPRAATRMPSARLPGVAPRGPSSNHRK